MPTEKENQPWEEKYDWEKHANRYPAALIVGYTESSDIAVALYDEKYGKYKLADGDLYSGKELNSVWHPKWLTWEDVARFCYTALITAGAFNNTEDSLRYGKKTDGQQQAQRGKETHEVSG